MAEAAKSAIGKYKIAVTGATGAVGRETVSHALANPAIKEVSVLIRKKSQEVMDDWESKMSDNGIWQGPTEKLNFLESKDFSDL